MRTIKKNAPLISIQFVLCLASAGAAFGGDSDPPDWPGAGKATDWYAACKLDDQANKVAEDIYKPPGDKPDRAAAEKAIALYKQAIAKYPFETAFYDNLAKCYSDLGDDKQADGGTAESTLSYSAIERAIPQAVLTWTMAIRG